MSIFKDMYDLLKSNNIDTYFPGMHKGPCVNKYVVVRDAGKVKIGTFSSYDTICELLLYVPEDSYGDIEEFQVQINEIVKQAGTRFKPTYSQQPVYYDDEKHAWMCGVEYLVHVKI